MFRERKPLKLSKKSLFKKILEKWNKSIEKHLVFYVPNHILAIFEPVVGDFCEIFSNKGFFDSLVGRLNVV
jgi:hypothetical protein